MTMTMTMIDERRREVSAWKAFNIGDFASAKDWVHWTA